MVDEDDQNPVTSILRREEETPISTETGYGTIEAENGARQHQSRNTSNCQQPLGKRGRQNKQKSKKLALTSVRQPCPYIRFKGYKSFTQKLSHLHIDSSTYLFLNSSKRKTLCIKTGKNRGWKWWKIEVKAKKFLFLVSEMPSTFAKVMTFQLGTSIRLTNERNKVLK